MTSTTKVVPLSLRNAPALIEGIFPAQKLSYEAQTERKSGAGQTLTALGGYWKGRKPLILVRACVLGSLLPQTDPARDLEILELLLGIADESFELRLKKLEPADILKHAPDLVGTLVTADEKWLMKGHERAKLCAAVLSRMPYAERVGKRSKRPEELPPQALDVVWSRVNRHLGTDAGSIAELVNQLGIMRFGEAPIVGDVFSGGGSIPFEAARIGCRPFASDLNPIACMLTWGAISVLGATDSQRGRIEQMQRRLTETLFRRFDDHGLDKSPEGFRAKAHLYCLEVTCPETGWRIPLSGTWLVSSNQRVVAVLTPNPALKRFDIAIKTGASDEEIEQSKAGTVKNGHMVYSLNNQEHRISIASLRGDRRNSSANQLRQWEKTDICPAPADVFQERLYCVQWSRGTSGKRDDTFFAAPSSQDLAAEERLAKIVRDGLKDWMAGGSVSSMEIHPGKKTDELTRTRGWTYWHHAFPPRHVYIIHILLEELAAYADDDVVAGAGRVIVAKCLDKLSKLTHWHIGHGGKDGVAPSGDNVENVFYNQALNTFYNYGCRTVLSLMPVIEDAFPYDEGLKAIHQPALVQTSPASSLAKKCHYFVTDPPYADAVSYHEITEFFIAWLRGNPPPVFKDWVWDSRRGLAVQGTGDDFRREMVKAYAAMANNMPDDGLQIVMFTHQDGSVWADMAGIFWASSLRVTAAWYIATETTSELKKGGYVQGTVILVLRKRTKDERAYKDELVIEIRQEVQRQIETMVGLNQSTRSHGRSENLFEDADLQMAGYAAALRVLTSYTHIDGTDMTREALRPRVDGERSLTDEVIDLAVSIANEYLVPEGLGARVWERLNGSERFYLRMLDVETTGAKKLDSYQNFAKAFKVPQYQPLMHSVRPNDARLKSATEFGRAEFSGDFGTSMLRAVLYALMELQKDVEPDEVMSHLRDNVTDYFQRRDDIAHVALYLASKLEKRRTEEASAARVLNGLVVNERVGA